VWSCGVTLYVMLVGAYPFEDQEDPKNFRKTINVLHSLLCVSLFYSSSFFSFFLFTVYEFLVVYLQRIMAVQYKIPDYVHISQDCRHLLSRIFVANPIRVWMNKPCLNLTINLYCEDTSYYIVLVDVLSLNFNQSGN